MRETTLPTDPPPTHTLAVLEWKVIEDSPGIPHGRVYLTCRRPGCEVEFDLPPDYRLNQLGLAAHNAGWTRHESLGPVCPEHPVGTPMGELEASAEALNRSRQELLETGEWDPTALLGAPAEDPETTRPDAPTTDDATDTAEEAKSDG